MIEIITFVTGVLLVLMRQGYFYKLMRNVCVILTP